MSTPPLRPAAITWLDDGTPFAPDFGDVYHARVGAAEQARHVAQVVVPIFQNLMRT